MKPIADYRIVLPVLDRDTGAVRGESVAVNHGTVAIAAPDAVVVPDDPVAFDGVPAERDFNPVRGRVTEIIPVNQVVVAAALPRIHGALPRPEEQAISAMGHRVPRDDVPGALLEQE